MSGRVRILGETILAKGWSTLKKITFEFRRNDGGWQHQSHEIYDRGDGAVILLYNPGLGTVILIRQFRLPTLVNGHPGGMMIEACAGALDGEDPADCIRRETAEETGFRIDAPRLVFTAYMSPGSVTEKLHFFVAEYRPGDRVSDGGGAAHEGEDIEVLELPLPRALAMIASGEICDAKTIMLLQYARLQGLA